MEKYLNSIGLKSKKAILKRVNNKVKNKVLIDFKKLILEKKNKIIKENQKDIRLATRKGIKENLIKRLSLSHIKIDQIISSINTISKLKDPTNITLNKWKRPNGLIIKKVTIPIGVMGVIYESRPNVTADVSSLCFKSGNSVILKGGSEAYFTNKILADLFRKSLKKNKLDQNYVQYVNSKDRKVVDHMLSNMKDFIDIIIPRGGKNLVKKVQEISTVPTIGHLEGICHTYIDKEANLKMALKVILNAKLRNTAICGATETIILHKNILKKFTKQIIQKLEDNNCEIYADKRIRKIYKGNSKIASEKNWKTEYLSSTISIKTVDSLQEAVNHINKYGTMHTDSIITKNKKRADYFTINIKSSIAMHNTSTQFADGGEFGFGGEVGISTNTMPPRGPVGLNQLVTYKYIVLGTGQIRK